MIRTAFCTIACPEWTLDRVVRVAGDLGFDGVDLRTWGMGGGPRAPLTCDPGLTAGAKVRRIFADQGIDVCGLATDLRFDAPIFPPVIGNVLRQRDASVRMGRHLVALASDIGAAHVRVFPLHIPRRERRHRALRRICERLAQVCDHARNRDVSVVIENEGSFASAWDLIEIIEKVGSPQLLASYNLLAGVRAGDDVARGAHELGPKLAMARVRDVKEDWPVVLGEGELPVADFVRAVGDVSQRWGTRPWTVFSWDRMGVAGLEPPGEVLPGVPEKLIAWSGTREATGTRDQPAWMSAAPTMTLGL